MIWRNTPLGRLPCAEPGEPKTVLHLVAKRGWTQVHAPLAMTMEQAIEAFDAWSDLESECAAFAASPELR